MVVKFWTFVGIVGLGWSGVSGVSWAQDPPSDAVELAVLAPQSASGAESPSEPTPTLAADPQDSASDRPQVPTPNSSVDMLAVERLRLEQQVQQVALKLQSLVSEIRRVDRLQQLRLGKTLAPNHPRMLSLQQAQEKSEQAIGALQTAVASVVVAQLGEHERQVQLQRGIQDWPLTSELEKKSRGESLEWSTETQAQVMEERMQKMQEYLLLTNLEAIAKARASAEAAWAAKVAEDARVEKLQARAEALARKQAAAQAVAELQQAKATQQPATPAGRNGEGPNQAKEPDASPRFPRQAANPFGLPNNQGTPGLVRPLYQPGPQSGTRPSPEQLQEMQLLMQKMSAQPAKPVAIEKRLEQLEGRLERIETLLQRLVQERAPEQD